MTKSCEEKNPILDGGSVGSLQPLQRGTSQVGTVRHFFPLDATLHKIQSPKLSNSFASNPLNKNLQVLSEPRLGRNPEALAFLLKEGDETCEQYQHEEESKKQTFYSRVDSVNLRASYKKVALQRLIKLLQKITSCGALSVITVTMSWMLFCSSAIGAETVSNFNSFNCVNALIGEVEGESFLTKLATAECLRNRGTLKGVYGINSKRIAKASDKVKADCLRAWTESSRTNLVKGATVWGNASDVKIFKKSKWFKSFKQTAHIGNHYFFREIKK
jgi:hypothetical protein